VKFISFSISHSQINKIIKQHFSCWRKPRTKQCAARSEVAARITRDHKKASTEKWIEERRILLLEYKRLKKQRFKNGSENVVMP
jgi:hypothetical protein